MKFFNRRTFFRLCLYNKLLGWYVRTHASSSVSLIMSEWLRFKRFYAALMQLSPKMFFKRMIVNKVSSEKIKILFIKNVLIKVFLFLTRNGCNNSAHYQLHHDLRIDWATETHSLSTNHRESDRDPWSFV